MDKYNVGLEILIESIDSKLRLGVAALAGFLFVSGCLIYRQAAYPFY